jgi:hypothetical protein
MDDAEAYLIISKPYEDKCPWVAKKVPMADANTLPRNSIARAPPIIK